jgi:hypothetical protein
MQGLKWDALFMPAQNTNGWNSLHPHRTWIAPYIINTLCRRCSCPDETVAFISTEHNILLDHKFSAFQTQGFIRLSVRISFSSLAYPLQVLDVTTWLPREAVWRDNYTFLENGTVMLRALVACLCFHLLLHCTYRFGFSHNSCSYRCKCSEGDKIHCSSTMLVSLISGILLRTVYLKKMW